MATTKRKTQNVKVKTITQKSKVEKKTVAKSTVKAAKGRPELVSGSHEVKKDSGQARMTSAQSALSVVVYDMLGKEKGTVALPARVFGAKVNPALMSQAVRVYLANQRMGSAKTKTRGQVDGSTRKIYQQKGTGRARHGGIRAPLFVGGGIAHGPKIKDYSLNLSAKMRRAALLSALSVLAGKGMIKVVAGFEQLSGKTQEAAKAFAGMGLTDKKTLFVLPKHNEKVFKATRNLDRMSVLPVQLLSTYDVMNAGAMVVMKEALEAFEKLAEKKEVK